LYTSHIVNLSKKGQLILPCSCGLLHTSLILLSLPLIWQKISRSQHVKEVLLLIFIGLLLPTGLWFWGSNLHCSSPLLKCLHFNVNYLVKTNNNNNNNNNCKMGTTCMNHMNEILIMSWVRWNVRCGSMTTNIGFY
jgi:hypothetical protein